MDVSQINGAQKILMVLSRLTNFLGPRDLAQLTATCRVLSVARDQDLYWRQDVKNSTSSTTLFVNSFNGKRLVAARRTIGHGDFIRLTSKKLLQSAVSMLHFLAATPGQRRRDDIISVYSKRCQELERTVAKLKRQVQSFQQTDSKVAERHETSLSSENALLRQRVEELQQENQELRQLGRHHTLRRARTVNSMNDVIQTREGIGTSSGKSFQKPTIASESKVESSSSRSPERPTLRVKTVARSRTERSNDSERESERGRERTRSPRLTPNFEKSPRHRVVWNEEKAERPRSAPARSTQRAILRRSSSARHPVVSPLPRPKTVVRSRTYVKNLIKRLHSEDLSNAFYVRVFVCVLVIYLVDCGGLWFFFVVSH